MKLLLFSVLIAALIVPISGCTICSNTPTPTPVASPTKAPTATPAAEQVWDNGNVYAITGAAKNPTTVTFNKSVNVSYMNTYHWNSGRGATPGTIGLKAEDGTMYGPWQATGADGQGGVKNAYWIVRPNAILPAGTYTVVDSDPSTFATNSAADNKGMAHITYTVVA